MLKYDDKKIELVIKAERLLKYDKETKELIVEIVFMNLLGRRIFLKKVDYFDIADKFDSVDGITEIEYLPKLLLLNDKSLFERQKRPYNIGPAEKTA